MRNFLLYDKIIDKSMHSSCKYCSKMYLLNILDKSNRIGEKIPKSQFYEEERLSVQRVSEKV